MQTLKARWPVLLGLFVLIGLVFFYVTSCRDKEEVPPAGVAEPTQAPLFGTEGVQAAPIQAYPTPGITSVPAATGTSAIGIGCQNGGEGLGHLKYYAGEVFPSKFVETKFSIPSAHLQCQVISEYECWFLLESDPTWKRRATCVAYP